MTDSVSTPAYVHVHVLYSGRKEKKKRILLNWQRFQEILLHVKPEQGKRQLIAAVLIM